MKNTDPPHRNHKSVRMTPEVSRFIEGMGMYFEDSGIPRIGGRILAMLMISHDPLSAEELGSILKVSRGSISTNMRLLTESRLVDKVSLPGERTTYFEFPETALEQTIAARIQSSLVFRRLVEQGLDILPAQDFARHRLENSILWTDLLVDTFQKAIAEWHANQRAQTEKKLQNKLSKVSEADYRVPKSVLQKS